MVVVLVAAAIAAFALQRPADAPLRAIVHDGAGNEHVLNLAEDSELVVDTDYGRNVVRVSSGTVAIVEADCPGGDCLRQHAISTPGQQLICLPHHLWVEVVADGDAAGQMDVQAVQPRDDVDLIAR